MEGHSVLTKLFYFFLFRPRSTRGFPTEKGSSAPQEQSLTHTEVMKQYFSIPRWVKLVQRGVMKFWETPQSYVVYPNLERRG